MAIPAQVQPEPVVVRVDAALTGFLADRREEMAAIHPDAAALVEAIAGIVRAGGGRMRPALVHVGHLAAGGEDGDPIIRAAASYELLHTMALIHDDVVDDTDVRRGVPALHRAAAIRAGGDLVAGRGFAVVAGDLAVVLADRMLVTSGFGPDRVAAALDWSYRIRTEMAAGQVATVTGGGGIDDAARVATLRGGSYTVEGPLVLGAILAGAGLEAPVVAGLRAFAAPIGAAFQLADDLRDGDAAASVDAGAVATLVERAIGALHEAGLPAGPAAALERLARRVGEP